MEDLIKVAVIIKFLVPINEELFVFKTWSYTSTGSKEYSNGSIGVKSVFVRLYEISVQYEGVTVYYVRVLVRFPVSKI
jgi:hypothetical protein